ncbi:hypothetical protein M407DRAFT_34355 [Tulasnella calospora MUT 4182]|uniref:F-box domain-containing protein n=1 Tax=Tulasnella calospora MUT 4182 TaxID=1051891 RepID=A0A0C3Q1E6_9AGAM|nr:hypothetical protein M407DRAFT_34355 [Tulasnella calospora MUT 4182]
MATNHRRSSYILDIHYLNPATSRQPRDHYTIRKRPPKYRVPIYNGYKAIRPRPSPEDFLLSLAHTFHRWSEYSGPVVEGYLEKPAPHMRKISLSGENMWIEPFELLGGSATNLRHVDLYNAPIQWKIGMFTQLTVLKLVNAFSGGLTTTHLLDTLQASPCIERLELDMVSATVDSPPSSQVITLPRLRYINFDYCDGDVTGAILRQIRAPSCTEFCLAISLDEDEDEDEEELRRILNEDLQAFNGLLRAIHNQNELSEITLHGNDFEWRSTTGDFKEHPTFSIFIACGTLIPCIRWVERILQTDPGLNIRIDVRIGISLPRELLERIAPMRCVTRLEIENLSSEVELSFLLKFIGKPLRASPSLPSLPCLRELFLPGMRWNAQNALDMVHSRFNSVSWKSIERTPLTINIPRGAFSQGGLPRTFLDLTTLIRIRETHGVECVQFVGSEECDGTLAIAWDEETSEPVWG